MRTMTRNLLRTLTTTLWCGVWLSGVLVAPAAAQDATALGSVRISRTANADGKPLAPGTYQVRLTTQDAQPAVPGQSLERWVEFVQGGEVKGREVASIIPDAELDQVLEGPKPGRNSSRVEVLKGNEYLRIWINRGGNNYLLHLPIPG